MFNQDSVSDVGGGDLRPFEQRVANEWPISVWKDVHVVLAVSGGADSIALLRAILALKAVGGGTGKVHVGHLDHGLRGTASRDDAAWLRETCLRLNIPLEVALEDVQARAAKDGDGIEAAARAARYDFLLKMAERLGARFVVTAHTASDQAETILHRIIRGTGLDGLAGVSALRSLSRCVTMVRPLLAFDRTEIIQYLAAIGQEFRVDSSNEDLSHTRNWIRHEMLPAIRRRLNADVDAALLRLAAQAVEVQSVLADMADSVRQQCAWVDFEETEPSQPSAIIRASQIRLDCLVLANQPPALIREVCRSAWREANWPLQSMGYGEWQVLALLVLGKGGSSLNLPGGVCAKRDGGILVLATSRLQYGLP